MTKICYFGFYNPNYSRNRILMSGLKKNHIEVIECNTQLKGFKKYLDLISKHQKLKNNYDLMIVGFPGYQGVILAKFISRKTIIFDAFSSIYDSMVGDRKLIKTMSLKSLYYYFLDWLSCHLADYILLDTQANIDYFVGTFSIKHKKFIKIFVGSDDEVFFPIKNEAHTDNFLVHFHGSHIPLQGVEYVLGAAKILENRPDIRFNIIGTNIKKKYEKLKLPNINFIDSVPYEKLNDYINKADVCLGVFGKTPKATRVIPNKAYEALATGCTLITGETSAAKEIFIDKENILFSKMADSDDLAKKILELKNNSDLRKKIAINGHKLFQERFTPSILTKELLSKIL